MPITLVMPNPGTQYGALPARTGRVARRVAYARTFARRPSRTLLNLSPTLS